MVQSVTPVVRNVLSATSEGSTPTAGQLSLEESKSTRMRGRWQRPRVCDCALPSVRLLCLASGPQLTDGCTAIGEWGGVGGEGGIMVLARETAVA